MTLIGSAIRAAWLVALAWALAACASVPAPVPEPAPATVPAAPPAAPPDIGTAHPVILQTLGLDGRWAVVCQARQDTNGDGEISVGVGYHGDTFGDALRPYLVVDGGAGRPIDAFVSSTPDGRWLAYVEDGALRLWDSATDRTIDGASFGAASGEAHPLLPPAWGAFDDTGRAYLFYRDAPGDARQALLLDLAHPDAPPTPVPHGADNLLAATPLSGARHVAALTWPAGSALALPHTSLAPGGCRGPITSYSTSGGSNISRDLVRVDPTAAPLDAGVTIAVVAGHVLAREPAGALSWRDGATTTMVAPASCDGSVEAVGPGREVLVACHAPEAGAPTLHWVTPDGVAHDLGPAAALTRNERLHHGVPNWWRWHDGETWLVDMQAGRLRRVPGSLDIIALHAGRWLLLDRDRRRAAVLDPDSDALRWLSEPISSYRDRGQGGPTAWLTLDDLGGVLVLDLATGDRGVLTRVIEVAAALDTGWLLVLERPPGLAAIVSGAIHTGPLRWRRAAAAQAP